MAERSGEGDGLRDGNLGVEEVFCGGRFCLKQQQQGRSQVDQVLQPRPSQDDSAWETQSLPRTPHQSH